MSHYSKLASLARLSFSSGKNITSSHPRHRPCLLIACCASYPLQDLIREMQVVASFHTSRLPIRDHR